MTSKISVFMPFYNEEAILEDHCLKVYNFLKKQRYDFELVLVDDSSKDSSLDICKRLSKKYPEIRYIHYSNGPSRRENLARSFHTAKNNIVFYTDYDLAADVSHIPELINGIEKGYDLAIGNRYDKIKAKRSLYRLLWSKAYNFVVDTLFHTGIKDHQCGFKAFKKNIILKLISQAGYDHSFTRGWFWDAEILLRAKRSKFSILEVPVKWCAGKQSSFSLKRELKTIGYILRLFFRLKNEKAIRK